MLTPNRRTLIPFLWAVLLMPAAPVAAEVLWRGDFETGTTEQWKGPPKSDSVKVVTDPVREGKYAVRIDGTNAARRGKLDRIEFQHQPKPPGTAEGTERYFGWSVFVPKKFTNDYHAVGYFETRNSWRQLMAFEARGEDIVYSTRVPYARRWTGKGKLTPGRWHDFAVHVLWSRDPEKGFVEVWFDGELVVPRAKTATLLDENPAFFQVGFMRDTIDVPETIVIDHVIEATTLKEVTPPPIDTAKQSSIPFWDRFRGPNGTGTSDDNDVPLTFGASENMIWKVALPGTGNSSPIVWGKHVFLQAASDDGKVRSLVCIDTATGKILWQKSIPADPAKIRADSSLASSTPTTDGKAVYVSFWDGKDILVAAYDFQGNALWSKNLGTFNSQHGAGASPILYKDKLILANDMDKDDFTTRVPNPRPSMLIALDKQTGRLLWETPRAAERACYSAPFLLQRPGQKEPDLIVMSTTAVTGYSVETGAKLWEARGWQEHAVKAPMRTVASPTLVGDILCVCSGGDGGRFAIGLALPAPGKTDAPQRVWENRKDFPYVPSPVARGEHIYFVNDAGFAGCYEARTGKRMWFERLADTGFHASPLVIDGKIYATSAAGDVYVFAAEPTFRLLSRNELGETVRATAAVADGRLYVRGERHLFCIGKRR